MKKILALFLAAVLLCSTAGVFATDTSSLDSMITDTGQYLYQTVTAPRVGSVGGEWTVLGLARSDCTIPNDYFASYYQGVVTHLSENKGILHEKKHTEYARVILALTAIGKNPADVAGYNLLYPLGDYEKTVWQGINGAIWALIALDSGNWEIPDNPDATIQATRELYLNYILDAQLPDGGWSLSGTGSADPDITAMALQALVNYRGNDGVNAAAEKAFACMENVQTESGGFAGWDTENSESTVQMLVALCAWGISLDDPRFVKNGNTVYDDLKSYYRSGHGFSHTKPKTDTNLMATEQGFYALVALKRSLDNKPSLYTMNDVRFDSDSAALSSIHPDVRLPAVAVPGKTFPDIREHKNQTAIESLAERGIINGRTTDSFVPEDTMTRAEFATILVRGLGLPQKSATVFADINDNDWYTPYVNTAYGYRLVSGTGADTFTPNGTLTRQEAMTMLARAANLCGMDTNKDTYASQLLLAVFFDYPTVADWALSSCAFCAEYEILDHTDLYLEPERCITRCEVAEMLYRMLRKAGLL